MLYVFCLRTGEAVVRIRNGWHEHLVLDFLCGNGTHPVDFDFFVHQMDSFAGFGSHEHDHPYPRALVISRFVELILLVCSWEPNNLVFYAHVKT
jgi:hypothetical protein